MQVSNEVLDVNEKRFLEVENMLNQGTEEQRKYNTSERKAVETANINLMSLHLFWKQYHEMQWIWSE